jgi:hypothetical protein
VEFGSEVGRSVGRVAHEDADVLIRTRGVQEQRGGRAAIGARQSSRAVLSEVPDVDAHKLEEWSDVRCDLDRVGAEDAIAVSGIVLGLVAGWDEMALALEDERASVQAGR